LGLQALIEDYDLIDELPLVREEPPQPSLVRGENISLNPEKVKTLKRVQGALRLSAHILANDKTQLVGQLWGRMQGFDVPEIQQLLSQAKQHKTTGLRPLTPSLTSPGGRLLRTLSGHSHSVNAVAVTADGKRAISGSGDSTLKVWNLETAEELFTLNGHSHSVYAVAVTADGKRAISGSDDSTLKVWNLETAEELFTLNGHSHSVSAVAVTADGKRAISGSDDSTLKVWNLETAEELFTLNGHSHSVYAVAVTADGKRAISGSDDSTLKVWNLETAEELFTLNGHSHSVYAVAVTADGKRAISGSDDSTLKLWNLETGEELFTLNGHSDSVSAVAVTADGKRAISGSDDSTLKLWNLETGEELFTLNGHSDSVNAVAVTADGKRAISGSYDTTLKLWNLETAEVIASFTGESSIYCCAVTPDGVTIVAGEASGRVHFPAPRRDGGITMNTTPRSPIVTNTRGHPSEFQQIITEKSKNFVGREFVFAAINEFLHKYDRGYFTLIGAPGSGKTAILAKYVTENPHVIYYSAQVEGKNRADQFLWISALN
jgi:WD40 repeat protein